MPDTKQPSTRRQSAAPAASPRATAASRAAQRDRAAERDRSAQRDRAAEQAAARARERVQDLSGPAAWVAERAARWDLDGPDYGLLELTKYAWNPLMDYWFRMEIEGWEHIPAAPALLIGIHSGAPLVWDAWTVGVQWWRHFGRERPLHGTAHDALMAAPLLGAYFRRMGVLPAHADSITAALAAGQDVALWPGGERDSLRPWTQRDRAVLAGRTGFIRLAIRSQVPIVPIATVGGPDSMPVLASGRRLARALALDRVARLKMFPIALQVPWGLSPAVLPEIPLPTKIRTAFQAPVTLDSDPERADDDAYVQSKYDEVRDTIQAGMDALARRRRLPLFG